MKKILAVAVVLLMAASAQATVIGVNYAASGDGVSGAQGPMGTTNWNNLVDNAACDGGGWLSASIGAHMVDNTGTDVGASMTYYDRENGSTINTNNAGPYGGLYAYGVSGTNGFATAMGGFSSTAVDGKVDVWVGISANTEISFGGVTAHIATYVDPSTGWQEATSGNSWTGNYVKATQVVVWNGWIQSSGNMGVIPSGGRIYWQAVGNIPEPATMSLLVLGGVATLLKRRNRR